VPDLFADAALVEKWRARIGAKGLKIGICWQGNSATELVDPRCCPAASFAPLAELAGVRLIGLQKGDGEEQLNALPAGMTVERLDDLDSGPDAFADTAAVMQCLDLVITIDTSVAHLAGALGVRSWTLLPYIAEWRWLLDRSDTPWYPAMRLLRQKRDGDWTGLFDEVKAALAGLLKETAP
jgi:ADP-heptose:LPS heptosyltransferase